MAAEADMTRVHVLRVATTNHMTRHAAVTSAPSLVTARGASKHVKTHCRPTGLVVMATQTPRCFLLLTGTFPSFTIPLLTRTFIARDAAWKAQNKDESTKHGEQLQTKQPVPCCTGALYLSDPLPALSTCNCFRIYHHHDFPHLKCTQDQQLDLFLSSSH